MNIWCSKRSLLRRQLPVFVLRIKPMLHVRRGFRSLTFQSCEAVFYNHQRHNTERNTFYFCHTTVCANILERLSVCVCVCVCVCSLSSTSGPRRDVETRTDELVQRVHSVRQGVQSVAVYEGRCGACIYTWLYIDRLTELGYTNYTLYSLTAVTDRVLLINERCLYLSPIE